MEMLDSTAAGHDPQTVREDPQTVGQDPRTVGQDPQTVGLDPQTVGLDPQTVGQDPRTAAGPLTTALSQPLTATGRVILGMLSLGKQTGYDIKHFVDKTTRHFWAASYGQIYPELRRLEEQGLVRGRPEPIGGRPRTVFELTDAGRAALQGWLRSDTEPLHELRDEGMLKLFFSDSGDPQLRIDNIRAMRGLHERTLVQLRALEPLARSGPEGPYLTLQLGIELHERIVDWCRSTEQALEER